MSKKLAWTLGALAALGLAALLLAPAGLNVWFWWATMTDEAQDILAAFAGGIVLGLLLFPAMRWVIRGVKW